MQLCTSHTHKALIESLEEYVAVVFDEMKIKEGIVYDKHECKIVGFVNLGALNKGRNCL